MASSDSNPTGTPRLTSAMSTASAPQLTMRSKRRLSRRTFLAGLVGFAAGGGTTALVLSQWLPRIAITSEANRISSSLIHSGSNTFPLRFTEVVAFRGDFGGNEVVSPKGIAYHPSLDQVIVSLSPYTIPYGHRVQILNTVASSGARARFSPDYNMYRDVESHLVIVPGSGPPVEAGFTPGDVFVGRGPGDEISRLSSNGEVISDIWANPGTGQGLWGGLTFDTVGAFGGQLIALTMKGKVFLIDKSGTSRLLKDIGNIGKRLEGINVAPAGFGPLRESIIIGIEGVDDNDPTSGKIYALSNKGDLTLLADIGYAAESIIFVPPNGGTYYQAELAYDRERENRLMMVSASQFLNRLGHMIVVNEYRGELWEVAWNGSRYTALRIGQVPDRWSTEGINKQGTELEAGCFAVRPPTLPNWTAWSLVPGNATTENTPAASVDANEDLHLLATRGNDRRVYINTMSGSTRNWTGWVEIPPGGLITSYPLASTLHDRMLYAFAVRDDGAIMHKRLFIDSSSLTLEPWIEVPGGFHTDAAVAATVSNGRLVLCAKGVDQQPYLNELEPGGRGSWSGWFLVPGGHTDRSPALAAFQDELYILMKDLISGRILTKVRLTGGDWTDWAEVPGKGVTDTSPIAVPAAGQLHLFVKGGHDHKLYWNVASNTGTWSLWQAIPNGGTTDASIVAAVTLKRIYLFERGTDDHRLYMRYTI